VHVLGLAPTFGASRQEGRRNVEYEFHLLVTPGSGDAYEARLVARVPWDHVPVVGAALPVKISASDPANIVIQWRETPTIVHAATDAADAALRGDVAAAAQALGLTLREDDQG